MSGLDLPLGYINLPDIHPRSNLQQPQRRSVAVSKISTTTSSATSNKHNHKHRERISRWCVLLQLPPSQSTFAFTVEQDCFIVIYTVIMRVERDTLTTIFNRNFWTSLSEETIARRASQLETRTYINSR